MSKEAMKLALEALKELVAQTETGLFAVRHDHVAMNDARQAITALREALAEQPAQQEPVVFYRCNGCGHAYEQVHPTSCDCMEGSSFERVNYYTTPQPAQRTWVGLTDKEIEILVIEMNGLPFSLCYAVIDKLRSKNT